MKCPLCGHNINRDNHNRCERFPICRYVLVDKSNTISDEFVLFDIETTGVSRTKDRITEIGAIKVKDGQIIDEFSMLVNPGKDEFGKQMFISSRITELTGITNEMVKDKKEETEAIKEFINWLGKCKTLAGQNVIKFDIPFMKAAAKRAGIKLECDSAIDTLVLGKRMKLKERGLVENYQQSTLANFYGFSYNAHRALDDVKACYKILEKMTQDEDKYGIKVRPEPLKKS